MRLRWVLPTFLGANIVHGDLTCLGWAAANPILGVVCAFKPDAFDKVDAAIGTVVHAAEKVAVTTVETLAEDLKEVGEFDLTHNPATLVFDYVDTAVTEGLGAANQGLKQSAGDYWNVTIGFAKEAANTGIIIAEWTTWLDFWYCSLSKAIDAHQNATNKLNPSPNYVPFLPGPQKVAPKLDTESAKDIFSRCASEKWKRMTGSLNFNITGENQKVGSILFDIATLLVPVGEGAKAGELAVEAGYDLAVAATEESSRIVKWLPEEGEGVAGSFESEEEALSVKQKLEEDKEWPKENCAICNAQSPLRRRATLNRRGGLFNFCCKLPRTDSDAAAQALAGTEAEKPTLMQQYEPGKQVYTHADNAVVAAAWTEEALIKPPDYLALDLTYPNSISMLKINLQYQNTAVVNWPAELLAAGDSKTVLSEMRKVFSEGDKNPLWRLLNVRMEGTRAETVSLHWMGNPDPRLSSLKKWATQAMLFAEDTTRKTFEAQLKERHFSLYSYLECFWTPAAETEAEKALGRSVVLDGHTDNGVLLFASADEPGLVVSTGGEENIGTRIVPTPDTFQVLMGSDVTPLTYSNPLVLEATRHAVFGPEITQRGRVSFIVVTRISQTG